MKNFDESVFFRGRVKFVVLSDINGDTIVPGVTTPDVSNRSVLVLKNTGPITITNFIGADNYRTIKLIGDGQTTIQNNAVIKTSTAADKLMVSNKAYNFTLISGVWIEDAD